MALVYVSEGSSTTAGVTGGLSGSDFTHDSYSELYAQARPGLTTFHNMAAGGETSQTWIDRAATTDSYLSAGGTNVLSVQGMSNSILLDSRGDPYIAADLDLLIQYLDARRVAGWYVVYVTQIARTPDSGFSAYCAHAAIVNDICRTWKGAHFDAISDPGADPTVGTSAVVDPTIDGVHPTFAVQRDYLFPYISPVLDAMLFPVRRGRSFLRSR